MTAFCVYTINQQGISHLHWPRHLQLCSDLTYSGALVHKVSNLKWRWKTCTGRPWANCLWVSGKKSIDVDTFIISSIEVNISLLWKSLFIIYQGEKYDLYARTCLSKSTTLIYKTFLCDQTGIEWLQCNIRK